jgi:hypothetical protein
MDFPNARTNLLESKKTISGFSPGKGFETWCQEYTSVFCQQLADLGLTTDEEYSAVMTRMNEYYGVGDFIFDDKKQRAEIAAFGLILFERIVLAEVNQDSHDCIFDWHENLTECYSYVIDEIDLRSRAIGAGARGGKARAEKYELLKTWALEKSSAMRGDDKGIARKLAALLPPHFSDVSKDPERLIYDALRAKAKLD